MKGRIASSEKPTDMKKHIRTGLSRPHEPLSATALVAQGWAVGGASLVAHRELRAVAWRCVGGNPSPVWKLPIVGGWNVPTDLQNVSLEDSIRVCSGEYTIAGLVFLLV